MSEELWQRSMIEVPLPRPGTYGTLRIIPEQSTRFSLFGRMYSVPQPISYTKLYDGTTLWMSDTPQERLMMLQGTSGMYGHVLVAGGGLGLYVQYLRHYCPIERITVVEQHPIIATLLRQLFASDPRITVIHAPFEAFIFEPSAHSFDCCYVDIHPTLDPRWLPGLNWLRDQCAAIVKDVLHIWGYAWISHLFVEGVLHTYMPLLRNGHYFDTALGRDLRQALPERWHAWSEPQVSAWLRSYAHRVAWPGAWQHWLSPPTAAAAGTASDILPAWYTNRPTVAYTASAQTSPLLNVPSEQQSRGLRDLVATFTPPGRS